MYGQKVFVLFNMLFMATWMTSGRVLWVLLELADRRWWVDKCRTDYARRLASRRFPAAGTHDVAPHLSSGASEAGRPRSTRQ